MKVVVAIEVLSAGALVLGLLATLLGLLLSIPLALAAMPVVQGLVSERLGPLDVPWLLERYVPTLSAAAKNAG